MKIFQTYMLVLAMLTLACAQSPKQVLIYTHNEKGEGMYIHDNIETSVKTLAKICEAHGITYDVSEDPGLYTLENLQKYDAIIFANTNNRAFDTQEQRDAFQRYIRTGGGFMGIHSSCGSERDWPWFWAMTGGKFVRHPKFQPFDIKVIEPNHPSTRHLDAVWHWEDECYLIDHLNPDIKILLAVDLTTIEDDQLDEFPGEVFGSYYPLAWYHEFDGGRQFYTALGHEISHYADPDFVGHLEGGLLWTVGMAE
ncbi:ThuA domain-containing protein [candidate division KSB1 bacterium]|nr:ThuA domain-containing protein [candidate division KSB1 bacterium]